MLIDGAQRFDANGSAEDWVPTDPRERLELERAQLHGLVGAPLHPDVAVNLRGERVATQKALLALKPRRLIAYRNDGVPETEGGPTWCAEEYEVQKWCRLLAAHGIPADAHDLHFTPHSTPDADRMRGATVIHPGAGSPARLWPVERWVQVAVSERRRGRSVVITGGPGEAELAEEIRRGAGLAREDVLAERTGVMELAAIVSAAGRVVCPDTGVAHLAVAVGTPSVTLFGPMPPLRWGPPAHLTHHRVLWARQTGEPYAAEPDEGLLRISAQDVINALRGLD